MFYTFKVDIPDRYSHKPWYAFTTREADPTPIDFQPYDYYGGEPTHFKVKHTLTVDVMDDSTNLPVIKYKICAVDYNGASCIIGYINITDTLKGDKLENELKYRTIQHLLDI